MSAENDEITWVFESLVGYLKGPAWNIPILTFIEQKSVVFEPDSDNEEYKKIHNEYKNLVDFMLGCHMEDIGITPEQFEKVCGKANRDTVAKFHQGLFEQVWAADDYEIFKRMMTQKNIELQLQALEILSQRHGALSEILQAPAVTREEISENQPSDKDDEEALMAVVIKKSMEEMAAEEQKESAEKMMMEEAIQATLAEKERLEAEKDKEKELLDKALKLSLMETKMPDSSEAPAAMDGERGAAEVSEKDDDDIQQRRNVSSADMKRRREYLRSQRDRLVAMKRAEREKRLDGYDPPERPRSSKAARDVLRGDVVPPPAADPPDDGLAFRKSLAARLKAEVVDS